MFWRIYLRGGFTAPQVNSSTDSMKYLEKHCGNLKNTAI
jgi:hypothetical protein